MGFLATLAFLGFGWVTFDGAITKREDPNHALTVAPGVDEWVLRRNRSGHYFSPGLINGQPVRFLLDTGATHTSVPAHLAQSLGLRPGACAGRNGSDRQQSRQPLTHQHGPARLG